MSKLRLDALSRIDSGCCQEGTSLVAQSVKNLPAVQETGVRFLGGEDPLEKEMRDTGRAGEERGHVPQKQEGKHCGPSRGCTAPSQHCWEFHV